MDGIASKAESRYVLGSLAGTPTDDWFATYRCDDDIFGGSTDFLTINTRQQNISSTELAAIHTELKKSLPNYDYSDTNQYAEV